MVDCPRCATRSDEHWESTVCSLCANDDQAICGKIPQAMAVEIALIARDRWLSWAELGRIRKNYGLPMWEEE